MNTYDEIIACLDEKHNLNTQEALHLVLRFAYTCGFVIEGDWFRKLFPFVGERWASFEKYCKQQL